VYKHASGRIQRHHSLNYIIARASAGGVPVSLSTEPSDISFPTSEGSMDLYLNTVAGGEGFDMGRLDSYTHVVEFKRLCDMT